MVKCTRIQRSSRKKLNIMIKDINNNANSTNANSTSANSTTNNQFNGCQHVQLGGIAFYDESKYFLFFTRRACARCGAAYAENARRGTANDRRHVRLRGTTKSQVAVEAYQKAGARTCEQDQGRGNSVDAEDNSKRKH